MYASSERYCCPLFCLARLLLTSDIELAAGKEQVVGQPGPQAAEPHPQQGWDIWD